MLVLLWTVAALSLLVWTGLSWALWALLTHDPSWVGVLKTWLDASPLAGWLDQVAPGWDGVLAATVGLLQALLRGLAPWVSWLLGAVWAGGCLLGLALAGLLHWAIRVGSTPVRPAAPPPAAPPPAAA